jgi:hypothetical protein
MLFRGYVRYPVPDDLSDVDGLIVELPTRSRSTSDNTSLLNPNCPVEAMHLDPTEGEMPALLVCDLTLGGCRLVGAQEARRPFGRVGSDPQPAIRRIAGRY